MIDPTVPGVMTRYVAFLRGMNVGGHRASKEELIAMFATAGFDGARTFRTSGNVVFDAPAGDDRAAIQAALEQAMEAELGYAVPTFLRDAAETRAIAAQQPFPARAVQAAKGKLQVSLLAAAPKAAARKAVLALASDDDRLAIDGSELYWLPSGGTLDTALDMKAIDAALGIQTRRTMGTIELIAAKFCAEG
jgi:uncharacterized protein (DUF1697 family)